jgi:hypothetical protein
MVNEQKQNICICHDYSRGPKQLFAHKKTIKYE